MRSRSKEPRANGGLPLSNGLGEVLRRYSDQGSSRSPRRNPCDADGWSPTIDLVARPRGFALHADLPGLDDSQVTVVASQWCITICGDRPFPYDQSLPNEFVRLERNFGRFSCRVHLPGPIKPESLTRAYANGVLRIEVRRKPIRSTPKQEP